MKNRLIVTVLLALACMLATPALLAEEEAEAEAAYSARGADSCLMCHRAERWGVMDIFQTQHGALANPDAPFSNAQCESCHGPSDAHVRARNRAEVTPEIMFGKGVDTPVAEQNEACLSCHQDHTGMGWFGSAHESVDVGCVSCHSVHVARDPAFDPLLQQEVCFDCHQRVRSDTMKTSGHGLRFGTLTCSDCHNVHDGNNEFLLSKDNVNDTCFSCHAEKRGPFLWEHAPATEDCTLCHEPHGSNHPASLTKRPPLLCQQCHSADAHPGDVYTSEDLDSRSRARFLMSRGCMNCHTQVHGSNHPSGSSQMR